MSMLNPPEREKYVIGAVVKGVAKHAKDILTSHMQYKSLLILS